MRRIAALLPTLTLFAATALAQEKAPELRYSVRLDLDNYPQATSKDAFTSAVKAVERQRADYLLAHLIDPVWVDRRVKDAGGFAPVVDEVRRKLAEDPESLKEFRRFLSEGDLQDAGETATVRLKDVKDRVVLLKKVGERWYLENRRMEEKSPEEKK